MFWGEGRCGLTVDPASGWRVSVGAGADSAEVGADDLAKYEKWKKDPNNRVGIYFGEEFPRQRGGGRRDRGGRNRNRQPRTPQAQPAPAKPGEVF